MMKRQNKHVCMRRWKKSMVCHIRFGDSTTIKDQSTPFRNPNRRIKTKYCPSTHLFLFENEKHINSICCFSSYEENDMRCQEMESRQISYFIFYSYPLLKMDIHILHGPYYYRVTFMHGKGSFSGCIVYALPSLEKLLAWQAWTGQWWRNIAGIIAPNTVNYNRMSSYFNVLLCVLMLF